MTGAQELIKELGTLSYVGLFFISFLSNVFIPVPEEVVILVLGYLAGGPTINGAILFPIVLTGLITSDIVMYLFSKRGNKLVSVFYDKVFAKRIEGKKEWITKHINKVVFFSRFLVQFRFLGPFFAGQTRLTFRKFFFIDFFALLIYTSIYLLIGFYFRNRIDFIIDGVNKVRNIIILVVIVLALASVVKYTRGLLLKIKTSDNSKENNK